MAQVNINDSKSGMKIEIENQPYVIVSLDFVKPGKGQAFTRARVKNLLNGRVVEKTYKSGEKLDIADIEETDMRMLYKDNDSVFFMDDQSFEQIAIPLSQIGDGVQWLMEEQIYRIIFYNKAPINVDPPIFMDLLIVQTDPGARGDTASGRVLKPAITESGAKIQIPIFIDQGERVKVDTRTGEYVARSTNQ